MTTLRTWRKTLLRFGLVSIPVGLVPAKDSDASKLSRNRFDRETGSKVSQAWTADGGESIAAETFLAYDIDGEPVEVEVSDDGSAKEIALEAFVSEGSIDPLYFDASYMISAADGGAASLGAVAEVLRGSSYEMFAGTARFTDRARSVVIRWSEAAGCLVLHTLTFSAEIRFESFRIAAGTYAAPDAATLAQAESLISSLPDVFLPMTADPLAALVAEALREAAPDGATIPAPVIPAGDVLDSLRADVQRRAKDAPKPKRGEKKISKPKRAKT